jgi:3-methyladenine DNA glycosylase AlkD
MNTVGGQKMSSKLEILYTEVIDFMEKMTNPQKIESAKRWNKEPIVSYGFSSSDFVEVYSKFNPYFYDLNLEERIELARKLIRSGNSTILHIGIHLLRISREELNQTHFEFFDECLDNITGWGNTDLFCSEVLRPMLEKMPERIIGLLRKWNKSENRWKRRASVVTFTRSTAKSGKFIDEALDLCENLIWDEEDLVRKGVGWALKDNMRANKGRVVEYVKSLRRRGVSSVITLYAIRDLKGKEREKVLKIKPDHKLERD